MSSENTFSEGVIEGVRQRAASPEEYETAATKLSEPLGAQIVSDAARRTNRQVAELSESAAEERAVIQAAQDQANRFNNWWGRVTGQHAHAVAELETVTESSGAKIEAIGNRIEELQEYFDSVVEAEFQRVSDPEGYAEDLAAATERHAAAYEAEGAEVDHDTPEAI